MVLGSGIRKKPIPDPGSRIQGSKSTRSRIPGPDPLHCNFVKFVATKKGMTTNFFHPSLLLRFLDPWPGIRDPGSGKVKKSGSWIRDKYPGSATNIPDPQHCLRTLGSGILVDDIQSIVSYKNFTMAVELEIFKEISLFWLWEQFGFRTESISSKYFQIQCDATLFHSLV